MGGLDCRQLFWTRDELETLAVRAKAEEGDAEAQLELYHANATSDFSRLVWLCRSADQSYPYAQAEVGRIYDMGLFGVPRDLRRAYVWYVLARKAKPDSWKQEYLTITRKLSRAQLRAAEAMLVDWKPGQCESQLGAVDSGD
jgi:hypothetical protein